uniref:Uncharacterized protein n=1 Tax=Lactuca sativa TaxID=4236 RepID=A0A9R1UYK4_LACSA|nr:hypothetical protein LSAT_V11C700356550 [Lactuca sativa]
MYLRIIIGGNRQLGNLFFTACILYAIPYFPNIRWNVINIDIPQFLLVLSVNQHNVLIITLIEAIRDYIPHTFVECSFMGGKISLTSILTPYAEMVFCKRMQKCVWWQATKIPPEISSNIYRVVSFKTYYVVDMNHHRC